MSDIYFGVGDMCQSPVQLSMLGMVQIENAKRILDAGAGTSFLAPHIIQRKSDTSELYLTDLSPIMVAISARRVQLHLENPGK